MLQLTPETREYLRYLVKQAEGKQREKMRRRVEERKRRLSKGRQETLVGVIARVLSAGQPTKFEYEGSCRHGLRRSFVLEGWAWRDADLAAKDVLAAALARIGATRPTWTEGQPEVAANAEWLRYFCARCGTPIPDERKIGGRTKFCSQLCVVSHSNHRARLSGERTNRAEWLASCASKSAERVLDLTKDCEKCGSTFIAERSRNRFCSYACSNAAQVIHPTIECAFCKNPFQARMVTSGKLRQKKLQKFCSRACSDQGRSRNWGSRASSFACVEVEKETR